MTGIVRRCRSKLGPSGRLWITERQDITTSFFIFHYVMWWWPPIDRCVDFIFILYTHQREKITNRRGSFRSKNVLHYCPISSLLCYVESLRSASTDAWLKCHWNTANIKWVVQDLWRCKNQQTNLCLSREDFMHITEIGQRSLDNVNRMRSM